ncbi:hypothetical protein HNR61_004201 [Actinomadura namibiensis]|uniref:Uncharacterized protein n=1 Tax=Actinomadura namibiensis TaxID=182080 RepID=A0A7W3QMH1_ACTNM|nr:hypothetical protein [Actinomadura namibiensis]
MPRPAQAAGNFDLPTAVDSITSLEMSRTHASKVIHLAR